MFNHQVEFKLSGLPVKKRIFTTNQLLHTIIFPLIALAVYCAIFLLVSPLFDLLGVNYHFVGNLLRLILLLIVISALLMVAVIIIKKVPLSIFKSVYKVQKINAGSIGLLLLPMLPILQYLSANREILSISNAAVIFSVFLLIAILLVFIIPSLSGRPDTAAALSVVGAAFTFTLNAMAQLSRTFFWYEKGMLMIQLVVFIGVLAFCLLAVLKKSKGIFTVIIISLLLVNCVSAFLPKTAPATESTRSIVDDPVLLKARTEVPTHEPNIYLLVYDAYVGSKTMSAYGIDNSPQEAFLQQNGFKFYPNTYSIGATSIDTMSRVLNASVDFYGNTRRAVAGDGVVQEALHHNGYETYGIFQNTFFFRGIESTYDVSFPTEDTATYATIIPAILIGEFRFDFEYNQISLQDFNLAKYELFESMTGKRFIYMHTYLPSHSQNSGACLVNETELYQQRLTEANFQMQQDVNFIIGKDPGAIVIIAGDHGPYLTKNCTATGKVYDISEVSRLDIQDRYATFLAIRWPDGSYVEYDDITVLQDVFPAVFAYMYEDKSFLDLQPVPNTHENDTVSGVEVRNGIIFGGINDREPLFVNSGE